MSHGYRTSYTPKLPHLLDFDRRLEALDVAADTLVMARAATRHAKQLGDEARRRPAEAADHAADLAAKLAHQHIDVTAAIKSLASVQSKAAAAQLIAETLDAAADSARRLARAEWQAIGDRLIVDLDAETRRIAGEAADAVAVVDTAHVGSDSDALAAGGKTSAAWQRCKELAARLDEVRQLANDLRGYRIASMRPIVDGVEPVSTELEHEQPWELRAPVDDTAAAALRATLAAVPCQRTLDQWISAVPRIQAGYDAARDAQLAEQAEQVARSRQAAADHRADVDDRMNERAASSAA
jgi:hypothetical protein